MKLNFAKMEIYIFEITVGWVIFVDKMNMCKTEQIKHVVLTSNEWKYFTIKAQKQSKSTIFNHIQVLTTLAFGYNVKCVLAQLLDKCYRNQLLSGISLHWYHQIIISLTRAICRPWPLPFNSLWELSYVRCYIQAWFYFYSLDEGCGNTFKPQIL